ncbi:hypothetical protein PENTCL1PPCAC_926, partial [Pristionchus entomophagus]
LHLNVYTSNKCRESNSTCHVVFVIHGGVGIFDAPMKFPDETLVRNFVSQDIVVVSTAYRLGMFGAIGLGDENVVPANLNMHDILAALNFTHSEIRNFGGDKNKITILGQSEGAHFALMIAFSPGISTPGEKRRINGVISMSGPSGLETQEQTVQRSHAVATELGCSGTAREIMDCLRLLDTETIFEAAFQVHGTDILSGKTPIGITMAGELFPITNDREMRESKDPIRLMIGTTLYEMVGESGKDKINRVLGVTNKKECYEKYVNDTGSGAFVPGYNDASQEFLVTSHIFAKYQAQIGGEAYLYEYGYPVHGAHTDDAYFVLGFHQFEMDENEKWLSRVYPRYFTRFIKGEKPTDDWSPVKPLLMNYYSVNRSIADDVYPHTKFGYQNYIVKYYEELVKCDNELSLTILLAFNAPVEYKSMNTTGDFQVLFQSFTAVDAIVVSLFALGALFLLCCFSKCFIRICCCCYKQKNDYER